MSGIGKRDKRNPGHCWQDNELYDVFQPVIGHVAAHVFAAMTRWCYGSEVRIGLRELAEEAGPGRSTVHRATMAMQAVGMIRIQGGRGRGSAAYELLDLKEAARALGAQWDPRRASYVLNKSQVQELKKRVAAALACVPQRDATERPAEGDCVPQRDAKPCANSPVVSQFVSQKRGVCVPNRGTPSITQRHKDIKTKPTPVSPPASGTGSVVSAGSTWDGKLDGATERLAMELDVSGRRQRKKLREAIGQYAHKERMSPDEAVAAMIAAWREWRAYCDRTPYLRYRWGPVKFICDGHWRRLETWPDEDPALVREARQQSDLRMGMR